MNDYVGKTILVTGATGLIGSNIVETLLKLGNVKVVALSRSEEKMKRLFKKWEKNSNLIIHAQNIIDPLPQFEFPIDFIFHAASPVSNAIIREYPVDVILPNIIGTKNCLDFLRNQQDRMKVQGRIVIFSSVTVYYNYTNNNRTVTEEDTDIAAQLDSVKAPYSESKRLSEVLTSAYCRQYGIDAVIARLSSIYGYSFYPPDSAFYEFLRKGIRGEDIYVNDSGIEKRDNIYIMDAVSGLMCIGAKGKCGQAYNISSNGELGNFLAVDEMASIITNIINQQKMYSNKKIQVLYKEEQKSRRPGLLLDNTKIKGLGWNLSTSIEEGLTNTIALYRNMCF